MANNQNLKNVYLFSNLSEQEMTKVSGIGKEKIVMPGQDIFSAGQKAQSFFVIKMGSVKIFSTAKSGDDMQLIQFGSGSHFGEIPFLDGQVRSANATTTEQTTLIEFNYQDFKNLLNSDGNLAAKIYQNFSQNLSGRLRATTESLQHAKENKLRIA